MRVPAHRHLLPAGLRRVRRDLDDEVGVRSADLVATTESWIGDDLTVEESSQCRDRADSECHEIGNVWIGRQG